MLRPRLIALVALAIASLAGSAPAIAQKPASTFTYTGVDVAKDSVAFWGGAIVALNGDLGAQGFMLRALGVYAEYDYVGGLNGTTNIDGKLPMFDAMIGYQAVHSGHRLAAYIGFESQDHQLTPNDPTSSVNGHEFGFKIAGDARLNLPSNFFIASQASYSTAFDSYRAQLKLGHRTGRVSYGPELTLSGNESNDSQRIGGFLEFEMNLDATKSAYLTLSGGHQFADEGRPTVGGSEGPYGSVNLSFVF
jgi:hypothetical protein